MKKKIWAAALICIVVLGMLDGCGPKEKDTDKEAVGNTETEAVEGIHATETETEAQGNLKEDTWYVSSGMYQHKMETEENTAVIKNVNVYNMAGTMDGETFVQASDFTNHLNQAEYEISWNRTEADEEGNTVYTVTLYLQRFRGMAYRRMQKLISNMKTSASWMQLPEWCCRSM